MTSPTSTFLAGQQIRCWPLHGPRSAQCPAFFFEKGRGVIGKNPLRMKVSMGILWGHTGIESRKLRSCQSTQKLNQQLWIPSGNLLVCDIENCPFIVDLPTKKIVIFR